MDILTISHNILIVWGALVMILLLIISLILINILLKLNSIISDMKEKYEFAMSMLFKPLDFISSLIHKIKK